MPRNNPYAQGSWHIPQNPHSINGQGWNANASRPPTFGALPAFTSSPPTYLVFEFANVLNYGEPVAGVGLQSHTSGLEVVNIVNQQATSLWLQLSSDLRYYTPFLGLFKIFCGGVTNRKQLPNYDFWCTPVLTLGFPTVADRLWYVLFL